MSIGIGVGSDMTGLGGESALQAGSGQKHATAYGFRRGRKFGRDESRSKECKSGGGKALARGWNKEPRMGLSL